MVSGRFYTLRRNNSMPQVREIKTQQLMKNNEGIQMKLTHEAYIKKNRIHANPIYFDFANQTKIRGINLKNL